MPNGKNHGFVIQTRQKDDELWRLVAEGGTPIDASGELELRPRKVAGYSEIRFLAFAAAPFTIIVEQGPTGKGPFVQTHALVSAPNADGVHVVSTSIVPTGSYMRITVDNGGTAQAVELQVLGHPV